MKARIMDVFQKDLSELMNTSHWNKVILNNIASFDRGFTWKKEMECPEGYEGSVPVIRIPNVKERLDTSDLVYLNGLSPQHKDRFTLRKNDIIMVGSNGNHDRIGNICLIDRDTDFIYASFLVGVKANQEVVSPSFLFYNISSEKIQQEITNSVSGTTGLANISLELLKGLKIPLPPLPEQQRIATVLATVDEAIAATDAVIAKMEVVRDSICQKLITNGIGQTEIVRTRLGSYPKSWKLVSLGDIADIVSGPALGRKLPGPIISLPYLRVANVQDGYLDLSLIKKIDILESEREKWLLNIGDILLTEGGDWDKLGRGTIWNGEIEDCIHQNHIFRVRLTDSSFDIRFVAYLLSSFFGKNYFKWASKQSTNLASINQTQLRRFIVLQPTLPEQRRIAAILSTLDDRLATERAERDRLVTLKNGLMQVLLTGRVRIPPGVAEEVAPAHV